MTAACAPDDEGRCPEQRKGKFALLRCCYLRGHGGACNFVTLGVKQLESRRTIKQLSAERVERKRRSHGQADV